MEITRLLCLGIFKSEPRLHVGDWSALWISGQILPVSLEGAPCHAQIGGATRGGISGGVKASGPIRYQAEVDDGEAGAVFVRNPS